MDVVARLTGIKLQIALRTKFQPRSRGHDAEIMSNSRRFGSHAGKQRPENVGAVVVVRPLWLFTEDMCDCVAVLAVGCVLCAAALKRYPAVAALTSRTRWIAAVRAFDLLFD